MRLRFVVGVIAGMAGIAVLAGATWRVIDGPSCAEHEHLCLVATSNGPALTIQLWLGLLGIVAGLALTLEKRTNRPQDLRFWAGLAVIPSGIADLFFNWQAMGHNAALTQAAKNAHLHPGIDAISDIVAIAAGVWLIISYLQRKKRRNDDDPNH